MASPRILVLLFTVLSLLVSLDAFDPDLKTPLEEYAKPKCFEEDYYDDDDDFFEDEGDRGNLFGNCYILVIIAFLKNALIRVLVFKIPQESCSWRFQHVSLTRLTVAKMLKMSPMEYVQRGEPFSNQVKKS